MSAQQPQDRGQDKRRRGRQAPKPTLMESYSAFNDDHLQDIVGKIRDITRKAEKPQPEKGGQPASSLPADGAGSPTDHAVGQEVHQPSGQSTTQSTNRPIERPDVSSDKQPIDWPNERPDEENDNHDARGLAPRTLTLNENQAVLYHCLYWLQGRTTSLQRIGQVTGVSAFTLKHCLRKLRDLEAIAYHGRQNSAGRMGFSADVLPCAILLRGSEHRLRQRLEDINVDRLPIARPIDATLGQDTASDGRLNGPLNGLSSDSMATHVRSSSKEQLLQGLLLEKSFEGLNVRSLLPYLGQIDSAETLQDFLDMANACVAASRDSGTPIRNPKGFLLAQLRAGYINPPEGYKSRRVLAQERRNRQLETELEDMRRLKEEEERLELEVYKAKLTPTAQSQLLQEARARIDPRSPLSEGLQLEMAQAQILRDWMEAERGAVRG